MWNLQEEDALSLLARSSSDRKNYWGIFHIASELNRLYLALENHRHFAFAPKALRRSPALLLPLGPHFDDWGRRVVTSGNGIILL